MRATLDVERIAEYEREDPEAARAELNADFRGDLSSYCDRQTLEKCVEIGVQERPFQMRHRYAAF